MSSFAEIDSWEKEPSLQNIEGGWGTRTGDEWEEENEGARELDSLELLGACSGQVQRKARRKKGKRALPEA